MNNKSVYSQILFELQGKGLPEKFILSDGSRKIKSISLDGALDGMYIYHLKIKEGNFSALKKSIEVAQKEYYREAFSRASKYFKNNNVISVVNDVQNYLTKNNFEQESLRTFAIMLMEESMNCENVKFGILLLNGINTNKDTYIQKMIRNLALCNEFTFYCIGIMKKWDDGNNEIWNISRKVNGWGKIHAVTQLIPNNKEIREWIISNGCSNDIHISYLSFVCARKIDMVSYMKDNKLSREKFLGITNIVMGLIEDELIDGMSQITDGEEIIQQYLNIVSKYVKDSVDVKNIVYIREYGKERLLRQVINKCDNILNSWDIQYVLSKDLEAGIEEAYYCADKIDIKCGKNAYEKISKDSINSINLIPYIFRKKEYIEEVVDIYMTILSGKNRIYHIDADTRDRILKALIPNLSEYPNIGREVILFGANSANVFIRNATISVLYYWKKNYASSSKELLSYINQVAKEMLDKETIDSLKNRIEKLIN